MTIIFHNESDVIVYGLEKILSFARKNQQIFVAQCVWWLASVIGLEQGLTNHIDNLQIRYEMAAEWTFTPVPIRKVLESRDDSQLDTVIQECQEYLQDSRRLRDIERLKDSGSTRSGRVCPSKTSRKLLRKAAGIPRTKVGKRTLE